jgi:hypothetical protein
MLDLQSYNAYVNKYLFNLIKCNIPFGLNNANYYTNFDVIT